LTHDGIPEPPRRKQATSYGLPGTRGLRHRGRVMFRTFAFSVFGLLAVTLSRGSQLPPAAAAAAQTTSPKSNQQAFHVKGVVIEVRAEEKTVKIRDEEIPGYMEAMTMPFEVTDANELSGLKAGDSVSFRMIVTDTNAWIEGLQKQGEPRNPGPPTIGPFRYVREVEPLNAGDLLPEYHFTNHLGQALSTSQFRGRALAITFIFTRCPYPTFCPRTTGNFEETQNKLLTSPHAPSNWHLLTISFDPEWDTPARLKTYAGRFHCNANYWSFATGELIDITAIAEQVGMLFWHEGEGAGISHNLRTVVVDARGRVQKIFRENQWTSDELVAEMIKAARPTDGSSSR
jgi:protein SCO1/2